MLLHCVDGPHLASPTVCHRTFRGAHLASIANTRLRTWGSKCPSEALLPAHSGVPPKVALLRPVLLLRVTC